MKAKFSHSWADAGVVSASTRHAAIHRATRMMFLRR
jgi:hypothetical protein